MRTERQGRFTALLLSLLNYLFRPAILYLYTEIGGKQK